MKRQKLKKDYLHKLLTLKAPKQNAKAAAKMLGIAEDEVSIVDALIARLLHEGINKGDVSAIKDSLDRLYGKAIQKQEVTGKDGDPLFPEKDEEVTASDLALNMGVMNLLTPFLGGIPLCHGSGGLASQYAFGARTGGSMILEGILEIFLGLF